MVYFSEFPSIQKVSLSVFSLTKILISSSIVCYVHDRVEHASAIRFWKHRRRILSKLLLSAALKLHHWITTILLVVSHLNLSVLGNKKLSVSLCREIDKVFGAVRTCFDHVLSKFSGFSWERILFLNSACVNMVMQIQVQIGDTRRVFFMSPPGSVED